MSWHRAEPGRPPTDRQRDILAWIVESEATMGRAPTLREIGDHFGIRSTNGVNDHLKMLEARGLISRPSLKSRGILVTNVGLVTLGLRRCQSCSGTGHVK